EGIEEVVLQRDVAVLAYDPPVIPGSAMVSRPLLDGLITLCGPNGQATGRIATQQQRKREEQIEKAGQQADTYESPWSGVELTQGGRMAKRTDLGERCGVCDAQVVDGARNLVATLRSEEHTSELQSRSDLVC